MPSHVPTPPELSRIPVEVPEEGSSPALGKGTRSDITSRIPVDVADIRERVALIAHDLKTPLAIILLETQLLGERLSAQLPAVQHSLDRISQNTAYIDRLVADMLDLASLEAGELHLRIERVDLGALLQDTVDRAVSTVDRARVQLELRADAAVHGDRNRLERVVANFISNALKYSATPITVSLDVTDHARVTVIDRGQGLTPEQAQNVFDRYRRVSTGREGHGLGLYISRKIIDAHGGKIGVIATPGAGCEFYFELATIV